MTLSAKQPRPKKCRACRETFAPAKSMQIACSPKCALDLVAQKREQERKSIQQRERRELKARKEKLKSRRDYLREAQQAVNAYIRLRDKDQPCISCDSTTNDAGLITGSRWDAGHYRSTGSCPELRFEPLNVHKQCVRCNRDLSGNAVEYRIRLVLRIGADQVAWLEGSHEAKRYTIEELKAIKAEFRAKTRELKKGDVA